MSEQALKRLINGHYSFGDNILARCHVMTHRGYLTKALIKSHGCLNKRCTFFEKLRKDYWRQQELDAQKKKLTSKENRLKRKQAQARINDRNEIIRETLQDSGHIHVTAIRDEPRNGLAICYIYDKKVDLTPEITFLCGKLKKKIRLRAVFAPEDNIEQLIRKPRRDMRKVHDLRDAPLVGNATKKRLEALGIYCLEDLFGRSGDKLYELDCKLSGQKINRRYLAAYCSAVSFANSID
jgi:hypothetical protein